MRITAKGQVTIPIHIREQLGLLPDTEVAFVVKGDCVQLRRVATKERESRGRNIVRRLKGRATVKMTTDEILALTRDDS